MICKNLCSLLYEPVQQAIEKNEFINKKNKFEFVSRLNFSTEHFQDELTNLIMQRRLEFTPDNIKKTLEELSNQEDLETKEGCINFIEKLIGKLEEVNGATGIADMVKKNTTPKNVYDFVYSLDFIKSKYSLRFQNAEVDKLSPGQRGALLLIFYLLVDQDKTPIILDQPEENLDNDTVVNSLVPILNEAKKTRQIIMVTHNPNLAIVCDAEQIIYTDFYRENNFSINYTSGSIESYDLNQHAVNILEGTLGAFEFSIKLIERIKHFFDIPNIVFILSTNKSQLEESINSFYGFRSANSYLEKFIDLNIKFPKRESGTYIEVIRTYLSKFGLRLNDNDILILSAVFNLNSRDLTRILQKLALISNHLNHSVSTVMAVIYLAMEQKSMNPSRMSEKEFLDTFMNLLTIYVKGQWSYNSSSFDFPNLAKFADQYGDSQSIRDGSGFSYLLKYYYLEYTDDQLDGRSLEMKKALKDNLKASIYYHETDFVKSWDNCINSGFIVN